MKHKSVKVWIDKVVTHMRMQITTAIGTEETDLNDKRTIVLNDNDVNEIFGWTLFKVKKKYRKLINKGPDNKYFYEKCIILKDMSVETEHIICNEYYVRMFYPLDDRLRNNGKSTLIHPNFCKVFSAL